MFELQPYLKVALVSPWTTITESVPNARLFTHDSAPKQTQDRTRWDASSSNGEA